LRKANSASTSKGQLPFPFEQLLAAGKEHLLTGQYRPNRARALPNQQAHLSFYQLMKLALSKAQLLSCKKITPFIKNTYQSAG
jgi:hypothetical protein